MQKTRLKNLDNLSPYPYKRCSLVQTELFNRLFQKDPGLTVTLGSENYGIVFEPASSGDWTPSPLMAHVRVDARIGFELHPEERTLAMMLSEVAAVEDLRTLPEDLRCVALEAALEKTLDRIDHISGTRSTIDRMSATPTGENYATDIQFSLIRTRDGQRGRGRIRTDTNGLEWIVARWSRLSPRSAHLFDHIPVNGHVVIGRARLALSEINSLEPLDIVLAEEAAAWSDRRVGIGFSPGLRLVGNMLQPDRFLTQDLVTSERKAEKMDEMKIHAASAAQWPVEDIPVELVFEIGRTEMPMGELRRLQPGYTVQLKESVDVSRPVTIKANGVPVGSGEIVLIDDRLGIRILEFKQDIPAAATG